MAQMHVPARAALSMEGSVLMSASPAAVPYVDQHPHHQLQHPHPLMTAAAHASVLSPKLSDLNFGSSNAVPMDSCSVEQALESHSYGHPSTVYVYNLPDEVSDDDMETLFCGFGKIVQARVYFDRLTKESKGFGFVTFAETNMAEVAQVSMNGFMLGSKRLVVNTRVPS